MEQPPSGGCFISGKSALHFSQLLLSCEVAASAKARCAARLSRAAAGTFFVESAGMHLRAPSIAPGVKAFAWAFVFAAYLWLFLRGIGISQSTSFILALVFGAATFVY